MPVQNAIYCFLAALIWGTAFVAQRVGGEALGPLTMNGVRFILGALTLLPIVVLRKKARKRRLEAGDRNVEPYSFRRTLAGGVLSGIILYAASTTQQIGIMSVDVGKAGFLTALYIVIVPVLYFFIRKKSDIKVWIAVIISLAGLYFLCISGGGFTVSGADGLLLLCAFLFSLHILNIDHFSFETDGVELSCIQFFVSGTIGTIAAMIVEHPDFLHFPMNGILALLYTGILSSGAAYTFQILGQKGANPTIASLILSLESVISAVSGFLFLNQKLSARELFGCILMALAIIIVQLPERKRNQITS